MRSRILVLVAAVVAMAGAGIPAADDLRGVRPVIGQNSPFPLAPGNRWEYVRRNETWIAEVVQAPESSMLRRVHELLGYHGPGSTALLAEGPFGTVVEVGPQAGRDRLWYLFGAPIGLRWTFEGNAGCVEGSRVAVAARRERVVVPAGVFEDAIRLEFDSSCADAGILAEWFAPGVGLIRREENSIAGPVVSELVRATVGTASWPRGLYTTTLLLDAPTYTHNLMPPVRPEALAEARGALLVHAAGPVPVEMRFSGCMSVAVVVSDASGRELARGRGDDGGCCACDSVLTVDLRRGPHAVPFAVRLSTADGRPLPDGFYAVTATWETLDPPPLRPTATARAEVRSVH
ncbi:MAG: hypothetical protein ACOY3Y_05665 [Acidobacteriota bacterium]